MNLLWLWLVGRQPKHLLHFLGENFNDYTCNCPQTSTQTGSGSNITCTVFTDRRQLNSKTLFNRPTLLICWGLWKMKDPRWQLSSSLKDWTAPPSLSSVLSWPTLRLTRSSSRTISTSSSTPPRPLTSWPPAPGQAPRPSRLLLTLWSLTRKWVYTFGSDRSSRSHNVRPSVRFKFV